MACVGSVKKPRQSNQMWELDGLFTREMTNGVVYRGHFFCAQRIIDYVLCEAAKTDTEAIAVVVRSTANPLSLAPSPPCLPPCIHSSLPPSLPPSLPDLVMHVSIFTQAKHLSVYRDLLRRGYCVRSHGVQYNTGIHYSCIIRTRLVSLTVLLCIEIIGVR